MFLSQNESKIWHIESMKLVMLREFYRVNLVQPFLRAPDCKYQKSYDRHEISDFILFHLNVPFGELFSKNTIKSPVALSFF